MTILRAAASLALGVSLIFGAWDYTVPHQNPQDLLLLVNKQNRAPVVPMELVKPDVPPTSEELGENIYMRPVAAKALEELFAGAKEDGLTLYATSGYRSYSTQQAIFQRKGDPNSKSVAKPGYSEHQTGLAMDVEGETTKGTGLTEAFGESPEGIWLAEHCHEYGFIIRYPKGKTAITGYIYEPWHVRYIGKEAAQEVASLGVTFEEYLLMIRGERVEGLEKAKEAQDLEG